ncbi:cation diffusion facilitator family transporter [bacterium]|nr:cation diffusion facilitator family transporter [bacterium]
MAGQNHHHVHHHHTGSTNARRLTIALMLTGGYLVAEVVGSLITDSLALLSDAAHMMTDVMGLVIALVATKIGERPADFKRTFGYRRFEILAAALNASALFIVAFYILYEAWQRFFHPAEIASTGMLVIAVLGLVVNLISMKVLQGGHDNLNLKAAYAEVMADMLGSAAVILAAIIIKLTGWQQVDPVMAVLIGLWVLPRTWALLSESVHILLDGVPSGMEMQSLMDDLKTLPGVEDVHELHVWAITSGQNSLTAHLVVKQLPTDNHLLEKAQHVAEQHNIHHTNFQFELSGCNHSNNCAGSVKHRH